MMRFLAIALLMLFGVPSSASAVTFIDQMFSEGADTSTGIGGIYADPLGTSTPLGDFRFGLYAFGLGCLAPRYCDWGSFNVNSVSGKLRFEQTGNLYLSGYLTNVNYYPTGVSAIGILDHTTTLYGPTDIIDTYIRYRFSSVRIGFWGLNGYGSTSYTAGFNLDAIAFVPVPASGVFLLTAMAVGSLASRRRKRRIMLKAS